MLAGPLIGQLRWLTLEFLQRGKRLLIVSQALVFREGGRMIVRH